MNQKTKHFLKFFLISFVAFTVTFEVGVNWYLNKDHEEKEKENKSKNIESLEEIEDEHKERINILVLGVDSLENSTKKYQARTDTIMIFSYDPKTDKSFLLSVPRDCRVKIPGRKEPDKINHAHFFGGTELALKTISNFLDIPIHHYVKVDYKAVMKTVDDIGGIEIDVPMDMHYKDPVADPPLYINLKKGSQVLDGEKAIQYLRFRKGYKNADLGRIDAQQEFLQKMAEKVLSPASVKNVPKYIDTLQEYVETDMSKKDMIEVSKMLIKVDAKKIGRYAIEGEDQKIGAISYLKVDENKKFELLKGLFPEE